MLANPNNLLLYWRKPLFIVKNNDGNFKFIIIPISNFTEENLYSIINYNPNELFPNKIVEIFSNKFLIKISNKKFDSNEKWILSNISEVADNMVEEGKMNPLTDFLLLLFLIKNNVSNNYLLFYHPRESKNNSIFL